MHDHQHNGKPQSPFQEIRQNVNILVGIAQCISRPIEALLRRPGTWGERYMSFQAMIGWLFCAMFSSFYRDHYPPFFRPQNDPMPMFYLLMLITGMLVVHRVAGIWRRSNGYLCHSVYSGQSWFQGKESTAKGTYEPIILIAFGIGLGEYNVPLCAYLVICGFALGINGAYLGAADNARLRHAKDAQIEAQWMQERMGG